MKHSVSALCLLACSIGLPALAQTSAMPSAPAPAGAAAPAVPAGPSKVAVVMFEAAVGQTNEGQRDFATLRTKYQPKEAALKTQSDEVEALKKQLQTTGATLSDTERASKTKTLEDKEKQLQRSAEEAQTDFNSEMGDQMQSLAQKVYNVAVSYAQENGFTLVLDGSTSQQQQPVVLWASDPTNITAGVVQAYNVKSGVPAQPAAAPGATPTRTPSSGPRSTAPKTPPSH